MIEEFAPAKINLSLDIVKKRYDDYHDVDMVMHSVALADAVYLEPADEVVFTCNDINLPCGVGNIAYEAIHLFKRYTGIRKGAVVHVRKRVPYGAGMGSGSSDAAAVIRGLNRLWQTQLSRSELLWLGAQIGMDVPFCISGGAVRATERGDVLTPLPELPTTRLVVVQPDCQISTAKAYQKWQSSKVAHVDVTGVVNALYAGRPEMVWRRVGNVFETLLFEDYPVLGRVSEWFRRQRYPVLMTGTGSAFFVPVESAREERYIAERIRCEEPSWRVWITKTRGAY